ncbi:hypothetical protein Pelo_6199 [Pelomyxa schiedti]|nr:hypothetical protein Pelo_6199 [Pelomyxa schiedti]
MASGGPSVASIVSPDKAGFLTKQGGMVKSWKKRWFVLKGNTLYYFVTTSDNEPTGVIDMAGARVSASSRFKHALEITTIDRVYPIAAESAAEMNSWIAALTAAASRRPGSMIYSSSSGALGGGSGVYSGGSGVYGSSGSSGKLGASAKVEQATLFIYGVMCDRCEQRVRSVLAKAAGVQSFDFNAREEMAVVRGKVDVSELVALLEDAGFFPFAA